MIHEILIYLTESLSGTLDPRARKFGHLRESISLIKRQKRCQEFWREHQERCKENITKEALKIQRTDSVLILGSGHLHEIPLSYLAKMFKKVTLVDIVHLAQTKKRYANFANVEFVTHDISELENYLQESRRLVNIVPSAFLEKNYDFVISANLLSQLAYHLKDFVLKNNIPFGEPAKLDEFCFQVSQDHLQYLRKFSCPVLLISDVETHCTNQKTQVTEVSTPYIGFELSPPLDEWWWNLAPAPEINKSFGFKMKVVCLLLNQCQC